MDSQFVSSEDVIAWWLAYGMGVLGAAAALFLIFERPINAGLRKIASDRKWNVGPLIIILIAFGLGSGSLLLLRGGSSVVASMLLVPSTVLVIGSVRRLFPADR